ncbi:hypothetical protein BDN70DRAFT_994259 [Pholiota conissans]|uniref:Heterokaryon incompatibility domain-containing protein n=1 Tax=Pholiota conissans TaxID=109636 RepID=A0A9P5Z1D7_9AGAR|nr:hypothetical protein BDN70DRAFT_994259 [Pholiota conissans]
MAPDEFKRDSKRKTSKSEDPADTDQVPSTTNDRDQMLSKALHEYILPLIESIVQPKQEIEIKQQSLGCETRLITALKDFIVNVVVNSVSEMKTRITVSLDEDDLQASSEQQKALSEHKAEDGLIFEMGGEDTLPENPQYTVEETLLENLRDHVYNRVPIRLLSFERHRSSLDVMLLERGAIFTRLEARLRRILDAEYSSWNLSKIATKKDKRKIEDLIASEAKYAILSHTWLWSDLDGEVTYSDWVNGRLKPNCAGYRKLANFCRVASKDHNATFGWMDTVCINKDSSSELDESIRSMYTWYKCANAICIIYLAETRATANIHRDPWFTRGWTLQELLAPPVVKFYNKDWKQFTEGSSNDKPFGDSVNIKITSPEIVRQIGIATTISSHELKSIRNASLSRKMQLAAYRKVTREEDTAYSLMGIFQVSIAIAYGEGGRRAFTRLLHEILNSTKHGILDLFNWCGLDASSSSYLLPSHPQQYVSRSSSRAIYLEFIRPLEPLTLTHAGIRLPVLLMPGVSVKDSNQEFGIKGNYTAMVNISPLGPLSEKPTTYRLLDSRIFGVDGPMTEDRTVQQVTFAVFNIQLYTSGLYIRQPCIAVPLLCREDVGQVTNIGPFSRIFTKEPVVFKMKQRAFDQPGQPEKSAIYKEYEGGGIILALDDLSSHGMQLVFKYI